MSVTSVARPIARPLTLGSRMFERIKGWLALIGLLVIWEIGARLIALPPYLLPTPSYIAGGIWSYRDMLLPQVGVTLLEAPVGFVIGCGAALTTALLFQRSKTLEAAVLPFTVILQGIPVVVLTPVIALIVGRNYMTVVVISGIICFFPVLINAVQGLRSVSSESLELMHVLAADDNQTFWLLRLPSSLPYLFTGLRIAAPGCILGAMVAEWLSGNSGLGWAILNASARWLTPALWGGIAMATILNLAAFGLVAFIERRVIRYRVSEDGISG